MKARQFKISNMIRQLQDIQKDKGDLLVFVASDEEGNQINPVATVGQHFTSLQVGAVGPEDRVVLTIYPCETVEVKK